ncbi:MAG TPA: thiamine pyrophosphate-dependent dehydrogenase E1 component subunit alpha [Steroidobacteraceae bacterium]|nr:thiamine pyrophosphate-dependent dehydrogenase E1 component subunit alpha [Steroidobacteraceae bacterium]
MPLARHDLIHAYQRMKTIREFEERLHVEIANGQIAGFTHLYAGQEAVAVGVCENLGAEDRIVSTHRGHGHCIAKGCDVVGMMKEIFGRRDGLCHGKGGSMHIADATIGMLGANGIVGAGAPIALGAALAAKMDGQGRVAVTFTGDGACNQGTTFEAMNMAVVLKAPLLFAFENNHYSEHTGDRYSVGAKDMASRAEGFGMLARKVDGCDFLASYDTVNEVLEHCRAGYGPAAIEFNTERFFGHFEGDPQRYRGPDEIERLRGSRDCLKIFRDKVTKNGPLDGATLDQIDADVMALIERAVQEARKAPPPTAADVLTNVYATY